MSNPELTDNPTLGDHQIPELHHENEVDKQEGYTVFTLSNPSNWKEAEGQTASFSIDMGGDKEIEFSTKVASYQDQLDMEMTHHIPDSTYLGGVVPPKLQEAQDKAKDRRKIFLFERIIGQEIPGSNEEEKLDYLKSNFTQKSITELYVKLTSISTGTFEGEQKSAFLSRQIEDKPVKFSGFDDWKAHSQTSHYYLHAQNWSTVIYKFPLRVISSKKSQEINETHQPPVAPESPALDPKTNKLVPNQVVSQINNPDYLKQVYAVNQKKTVAILQECLAFDIPGSTDKDKFDWIAARPSGEVSGLLRYIYTNIFGGYGDINFF